MVNRREFAQQVVGILPVYVSLTAAANAAQANAHGARHIVGRTLRRKLIKKPQRLLTVR